MVSQVTGNKHRQLALNEVFVAEKNVGASSIFRTRVDGNYIGKFKSSGMIIATGTGATGWLYSAKRFTETEVKSTLDGLGFIGEPAETVKKIADELSDATKFAPNRSDLYYYIREPIL